MAPPPITTDYYRILEVEQTASQELIIKSYRRQAMLLHPDKNTKRDTTADFQLLAEAYETLGDIVKRRAYDNEYPSILKNRQPFYPSATSTSQPSTASESAQIATLQHSKQERGARWLNQKKDSDSYIFELQRVIQRLELDIKNLDRIAAAERAEEAQKNSWTTWLLSPLYAKPAEDSEDEKLRKDRARQERRIEKDLKERRLDTKQAEVKKEVDLLKVIKDNIDAADRTDDQRIRMLQNAIWAREARERAERDQAERERLAQIRKKHQEEQERLDREAAEELERERQNILNRRDRQQQQRAHSFQHGWNTGWDVPSTCNHDGWWPKSQVRQACPQCSDIWNYLLQCPGCRMKACPKCQSVLRPRRGRNGGKGSKRDFPRIRTPSPQYFYPDYD